MNSANAGKCPWMAFVFGTRRAEINRRIATSFLDGICNELESNKFPLDRVPLRDFRFFDDRIKLLEAIEECVTEAGDDQIILLFLIRNDFVSEATIESEIRRYFSKNVILFVVCAEEIIQNQLSAKEICSEFLQRCPDYLFSDVPDTEGISASSSHSRFDDGHDVYGYAIEVVNDELECFSPQSLQLALDYLLEFRQENDAVSRLCMDEVYNRMSRPFSKFPDNMKFLDVICRAITTCSARYHSDRRYLLDQFLDERFLSRLCSKYLAYLSEDPNFMVSNQNNIFQLLRRVSEVVLTVVQIATANQRDILTDDWKVFCELWQLLEKQLYFSGRFLLPAEMDFLKTKRNAMNLIFVKSSPPPGIYQSSTQPQCSNGTNHFVKPHRSIHDEISEPFWKSSEKRTPPEDFRSLRIIPAIADLTISNDHYVRRAITCDPYDDSNHYLDVLFRLMREDLLSPLRDGLALHKKLGISLQNKMNDDGFMNDLAVYEVKNMGGAQVDFRHGHLFRYCELVVKYQAKWMEKVAAYGQLLCLSLDGFVKDLHIAVVVENRDGRIGLMFPFDSGIQRKKTYVVAEPKSYLEAYRYVLEAIKNLSRFRPIPFERYLVHAKRDVRMPIYMRTVKSQNEVEEETMMETFYTEVRLIEKARRRAIEPSEEVNGRTRKKKKSRVVVNDELDEPMFHQRPNVANTLALQVISIGGVLYNIAELEKKFAAPQMDESQRLALIGALTKELAVIQGPPGTGKTFLGVNIVNVLFENRERFNNVRPILLVCYTNTAVDQFLDRVHRELATNSAIEHWRDVVSQDNYALPTIVRIGSKSTSDLVLKGGKQINDVVSYHKRALAEEEDMICGRLLRDKRTIGKKIADCAVLLRASRSLFSYESLQSVIPEKFRLELANILFRYLDSSGKQMNLDEALSCWLLDKTFGKDTNPTLASTLSTKNTAILENLNEMFLDEGDDEEVLNKLLEGLNVKMANNIADEDDFVEEEEFYESDDIWDLVLQEFGSSEKCTLFSNTTKRQRDQSLVPVDQNIVEAIEQVKDEILKARALTQKDIADIKSIQSLTRLRRWELYVTWIRDLKKELRASLPSKIEAFKKIAHDTIEARLDVQAAVLKNSLIIGATTTGAAKNRKLLEKIGCKILIVEEAAEIMEAHSFACMLPSIEHAILIGDHQQLRPLPSVQALAREYHLDISMFERFVKLGIPFYTLDKQHRMNADITKTIVRPHFYEGILDHDSVLDFPPVQGLDTRVHFWTHSQREQLPFSNSLSYKNDHEIDMAMSLTRYLLQQGTYSKKDITIIAMYGAQVELLRRESADRFGVIGDNTLEVAVETVDSFQGQENKIIIVSLVRSAGQRGGIGFLSTPNRICVALTRAKHGLYILGNIDHLSNYSEMWRSIYTSLLKSDSVGYYLPIKCVTHGICQEITEPSEFTKKAPAGGCEQICGQDLPCSHKCPSRCHPMNYHGEFRCMEECKKKCGRGHPCANLCSEACGSCTATIIQELQCGHSVCVACYKAEVAICETPCDTILQCGHQCDQLCGQNCTALCMEIVTVTLRCLHTVKVPCYSSDSATCNYRCDNSLPCGHRCQELCSAPCTSSCTEIITVDLHICGHRQNFMCGNTEKKCVELVDHTLDPCGHRAKLHCNLGNTSAHCQATCNSELPCGHKCGNACGLCFSEGEHRCRMNCNRKLSCGHSCGARCGAKCKCLSSCITSCKHISCGKDVNKRMSFRRQCAQPCVLCWKACDNICSHRSCSLKCFEECDVNICNEPCTKTLSCKHACLGLCGDDCPELCGTCNRQEYKSLLSFLGKDVSIRKIHRIIMVPGCRHLFPVEYLDGVVLDMKEKNMWPCCPGSEGKPCGNPISSSFRYSRITKALTLHFNKINEKSMDRVLSEVCDKPRLATKLTIALSSLARFRKKRGAFYDRISLLSQIIYSSLPLIQQADSLLFWQHFIGSISATVNLITFYFDDTIAKRITDPPRLEDVYSSVFRKGFAIPVIEQSLDDLAYWLHQTYDHQFLGSCIPRARFLFYRSAFYIAIGHLATALKEGFSSDISEAECVELQIIAKDFLSCCEADDYYPRYVKLHEFARRKLEKPSAQLKLWQTFENLVVDEY